MVLKRIELLLIWAKKNTPVIKKALLLKAHFRIDTEDHFGFPRERGDASFNVPTEIKICLNKESYVFL